VETFDQPVPVASHSSGKRKPGEVFLINVQDGEQQSKQKHPEMCWKCGQTGCAGRANKKNCMGKLMSGLWNATLHWKRYATKLQGQS
jgi:hypothetical protein